MAQSNDGNVGEGSLLDSSVVSAGVSDDQKTRLHELGSDLVSKSTGDPLGGQSLSTNVVGELHDSARAIGALRDDDNVGRILNGRDDSGGNLKLLPSLGDIDQVNTILGSLEHVRLHSEVDVTSAQVRLSDDHLVAIFSSSLTEGLLGHDRLAVRASENETGNRNFLMSQSFESRFMRISRLLVGFVIWSSAMAIDCIDPVLGCQKCDTNTGLVVPDSVLEGSHCDDNDITTSGERCRSGVCTGFTDAEQYERSCSAVSTVLAAIESYRSQVNSTSSTIWTSSELLAWATLGFTPSVWAAPSSSFPSAIIGKPFQNLSATQRSAVQAVLPPRCESLTECTTYWSEDDNATDSALQWDGLWFGCYACVYPSSAEEFGSSTLFSDNCDNFGLNSFCEKSNNFLWLPFLFDFPLFQHGFCRPSISELDIPVCIKELACTAVPEFFASISLTTCPLTSCRSGKADWSLFLRKSPTLFALQLQFCRLRRTRATCASNPGHCIWRIDRCVASLGFGFAGLGSVFNLPGERRSSDFSAIPVEPLFEEWITLRFWCSQFSVESECNRAGHLVQAVDEALQRCYWSSEPAFHLHDPLGAISDSMLASAIGRIPNGSCLPCCPPSLSFDSYPAERGSVVLGYWLFKNCANAARLEACEGPAALKSYCVWIDHQCKLNMATFFPDDKVQKLEEFGRQMGNADAVCHWKQGIMLQAREPFPMERILRIEADTVAACEAEIDRFIVRAKPEFCSEMENRLAVASAQGWAAARTDFGDLGWTEADWTAEPRPMKILEPFSKMSSNQRAAIRRIGLVWDLRHWCGSCNSNEECFGSLEGSYCAKGHGQGWWDDGFGIVDKSKAAQGTSGLVIDRLAEIPWSGAVDDPTFESLQNAFPPEASDEAPPAGSSDFFEVSTGICRSCQSDVNFCLSRGDALNLVEGCGRSCASGEVDFSLTVGAEAVVVVDSGTVPENCLFPSCPTRHCKVSTASAFSGSCVLDVSSVAKDFILCTMNFPELQSFVAAGDLCPKYSEFEACDAEPRCRWNERGGWCEPGLLNEGSSSSYCDSFNHRLVIPGQFMQFGPDAFLSGGSTTLAELQSASDALMAFRKERCENGSKFFPNTKIQRVPPLCQWADGNCRGLDHVSCHANSEADCSGACTWKSLVQTDGLTRGSCERQYAIPKVTSFAVDWVRAARADCDKMGSLGICGIGPEAATCFLGTSGVLDRWNGVLIFLVMWSLFLGCL